MMITAQDWGQITSLIGLPPTAAPAEVITALETRSGVKRAADAAREARSAAIQACLRCDPSGWRLDADGAPAEPARRCHHGTTAPAAGRDFTAPVREVGAER